VVQAVGPTSLAPLAHGFRADAVALGHDTAGLGGSGDVGAGGKDGTGIRMDVEHELSPSRDSARQAPEAVDVVRDCQRYRTPTMFRNQIASLHAPYKFHIVSF
jgi:hypothetical protein